MEVIQDLAGDVLFVLESWHNYVWVIKVSKLKIKLFKLLFNPFLFLHNYSFYYVMNSDGVKLLIISKKKLKRKEDANFVNLKRINDYTFIDMES